MLEMLRRAQIFGSKHFKSLSVTLDDWSDEDVDAMIEVGGNSYENLIYEAHFPEGVSKIPPDASVEQRTKYIRSKYEYQDFLKPDLKISSKNAKVGTFQASPFKKNSFRVQISSSNPYRNLHVRRELLDTLRSQFFKGQTLSFVICYQVILTLLLHLQRSMDGPDY